MFVLFCIPMSCVTLFEAAFDPSRNILLREWANVTIALDDTPDARDPRVTGKDAERGLVISKVPFAELIKEFPRTTMVCQTLLIMSAATNVGRFKSAEATIMGELDKRMNALNKRVDGIEEKMDLIIKLLQEKDKEEWR